MLSRLERVDDVIDMARLVRNRLGPGGAAVLLLVHLVSGAAWAAEEPPVIRLTLDSDGESTRVVLTASQPVSADVAASKKAIQVVWAQPVRVVPDEGRTRDSILEGWRVKGDRTLVLDTGPGFRRHESFQLKNPTRLVLDLQGERSGRDMAERAAPAPGPRFVVVLDPGHGGVETGAVGPTGLQEKDLVLDLARRLKAALQSDPRTAVVLTRDDDRMVPLDERTAIANHNRADLFLSIHLNSARGRRAFGAETYYLSNEATDDETRTIAALENRAYESPQPDSTEPPVTEPGLELVLWDLAQNQYLAASSRLAEAVQSELNALADTRNRGVRQAPFRVLMGATMPAILVEVGFVSNPEEEERFRSEEHKAKLVEALVRAISQFRDGIVRLDQPPAGSGGN